MSDLIRVLDKNGNDLSVGMTRDEVHQNPDLYCLCAHVWIYNSKGEVLLQKRSDDNKVYPGRWDISSAGHVDFGEEELPALLR